MSEQKQTVDPLKVRPSTKLYGVTHTMEGESIVVEPRVVKVSIGLARGPAIHTYIDLAKNWVVVIGFGENTKRHRFPSKAEAQKFYRQEKDQAPERKYPERLPFFTFSRIAPDGSYEPDWAAIEQHGPVPTEIDIVFLSDDPFSHAFQYWTQTEFRCYGDGINGLRILSMAETEEEKKLAARCQKAGERSFPVINGCWMKGCKYSKPVPQGNGKADKPSPCKPHGRLLFQLLSSPRLGGTSFFDSCGYKSIRQIHSCIETFKRMTGSGDASHGYVAGIPLVMVLRPYRTSYNGRATTQYGVSLEFRSDNVIALKRSLIEQGQQFRLAAPGPMRQLPPGPAGATTSDTEAIEQPPESPAAMTAEFGPAEQPPTDVDEDYLDGPGGELVNAWNEEDPDPAAGAPSSDQSQSQQPVSAQQSPPTTAPSGQKATSDRRASAHEISQFAEMCRMKGIGEAAIAEKLGSLGFEHKEEIAIKALPELMQWAAHWTTEKQKSLL